MTPARLTDEDRADRALLDQAAAIARLEARIEKLRADLEPMVVARRAMPDRPSARYVARMAGISNPTVLAWERKAATVRGEGGAAG